MTASFEPSKLLFELTGWSDTDLVWAAVRGEGRTTFRHLEKNVGVTGLTKTPAYDLSFLVRKLQLYFKTHSMAKHAVEICLAHSPEDTAAELCIKLVRAGKLS